MSLLAELNTVLGELKIPLETGVFTSVAQLDEGPETP